MRTSEKALTAEARRELDAIDAALLGESVAADQQPLAELARVTRELRARPSEEFARALDAKAERGFRREKRRSGAPAPGGAHGRTTSPRRRSLALALGAGLTVLLAVAIAVSLSRSGGGRVAQPAPQGATAGVRAASPPGSSAGATKGTPAQSSAAEAAAPRAAARQVERTSTLDIGVAPDSVQSAAQRVFALSSSYGGYVAQSNVSTGAPPQGGASFDVRLPSSKLPSAIAALSHLGRVRSENNTTSDVTDQLGSLRRSLAGLAAERSSLLRQLAAATEAGPVQTLKEQLHRVEASISQVQGAVRALLTRVDYTSLALTLTTEPSAGASSGYLTPGAAAGEAARILDAALAVLVIAAAAVLPLAAIVLLGWMAVALGRRRLREHALDAG
jgi:hypothetical protein